MHICEVDIVGVELLRAYDPCCTLEEQIPKIEHRKE